jgi:hypothetical protein
MISDCYSLLREAFEHSPISGNEEAAEPGGNSAAPSQQGDREQVPGLQVMHERWDALSHFQMTICIGRS